MIEQLLVSLVPTNLIPWFLQKWTEKKTRANAWLALAEAHFNEPWVFHIYRDVNKCSPRVVRFAYGCRWDSLEAIKTNHASAGRVVVGGHFCYLVRNDLAVQSRSFAVDQILLATLIDDKVLRKRIGDKRLSGFVRYVAIYFNLGHREFFETYLGEDFWRSVGIKNSEYGKAFDDEGRLNLDEYEKIVCDATNREGIETIEYKIMTTHRDFFLDILRQTEVERYDAIQPDMVFGAQNSLIEYASEESLWDLFLEKEKGNMA